MGKCLSNISIFLPYKLKQLYRLQNFIYDYLLKNGPPCQISRETDRGSDVHNWRACSESSYLGNNFFVQQQIYVDNRRLKSLRSVIEWCGGCVSNLNFLLCAEIRSRERVELRWIVTRSRSCDICWTYTNILHVFIYIFIINYNSRDGKFRRTCSDRAYHATSIKTCI